MQLETRVSTIGDGDGYVTSVAGQDLKVQVMEDQLPSWNNKEDRVAKILFKSKTDCEVLINGNRNVILADVVYAPTKGIKSFVTVDSDDEVYLSLTF